VSWLAPRRDEIRTRAREREETARRRFATEGQHARGAPNLAAAFVGFDTFLEFGLSSGVITAARAEALRTGCEEALRAAGRGQSAHHKDSEPAARFLRLLGSALASRRAHIASIHGGAPDQPGRFGWYTDGTPARAGGERIGWVDDDDVLLEPGAAHRVATRLASDEGEPLGLSARTITKRLRERSFLSSTEADQHENTVRRTVEGERRRVLHLSASALAAGAESTEPGESGHAIRPPGHEPVKREAASIERFEPIGRIGREIAHQGDADKREVSDDDTLV
jgi:hypothetical protein